MDQIRHYIITSLELHLFFARIMKEHALFLEAGFTPANASFAKEADQLKLEFETLLHQALCLADGVVRQEVLESGEIVTGFTANAERQTENLSGIAIDREMTSLGASLTCGKDFVVTSELINRTRELNRTALRILQRLIRLKERIISNVDSGRMFTMNYPLLVRHILREAKLYQSYLMQLEGGRQLHDGFMLKTERFWNQIMMEHALFIRGLLDPSEEDLMKASHEFAGEYAALLEASCARNDLVCGNQQESALQKTLRFRDFKAAGTQGILDCRIRSVILPLLADHVLREANHYIRLLRE